MDRATHCPNCFREPAPAPRCRHCGFDAASYALETNNILPPFTPLSGGKYVVGRVLGEGGFGVVYAGLAQRLKRSVAIKEFFPATDNPLAQRQGLMVTARPRYQTVFTNWKEQFLREAELLAQFSHPRIVQVHDILEEHNTVYLIMERLEGQTLSEHLGGLQERGDQLAAGRALSPDDGQRLLHAALEALEALHGHVPPVLHRDLTPLNLFLVDNRIERLKVLDFGLARLGERTQSAVSLAVRVGNPGFAAPEQLGLYPGAITQATDFYTLGATLHTALTGIAPPNAQQRCAQQPPQSLPLLPNVDPVLAQVIRACLEISPKQRPQSVADIRQRLAAGTIILPSDPEPTPAPPSPPKLDPTPPPPKPTSPPKPISPPKPAPESPPAPRQSSVLSRLWKKTSSFLGFVGFFLILLMQYYAARDLPFFEPQMVKIPGGCFLMGSLESEKDRHTDERQHRVCVQAFEIGKYEVPQGQWKAVMGKYSSHFGSNIWNFWILDFWNWDNYPVGGVSWSDAQAFLTKLNQKAEKNYRLPTEAEWEYACRGGKVGEVYCGGDEVDRLAWYSGNSGNRTHPVGQKAANGYGLYDMSGNVWEWTCSAYDKEYGGAELKCITKDTTGPLAVRGGAWTDEPAWVRSANRIRDAPAYRSSYQGFRLARSL